MSETFSKIILTNSNVEAAEPSSSDLSHGELAINYKDGKIFFKNDSNSISTIASSDFITDLNNHKNDTSTNPHSVTKADVELGSVDNTSDLAKPISNATQTALNDKADIIDVYTKTQVDTLINNETGDKIGYDDLSVSISGTPAGNGSLSYNDQTGEFTYTPPELSVLGGIGYGDLSIASEPTPAGNGDLSYDNQTGVFTYTPPILNGLTATGVTVFGSNKIFYANSFTQTSSLPTASTYPGMFAQVSATGAAYFASGGNWIELANKDGIIEDLNAIGAPTTQEQFIVSTGAGTFAYQSGSTVRDSLGLGASDTPQFGGIDADNININTNTISSTDTDGDINITPNGTGKMVVGGEILPDTTNDIDLGSDTKKFKDLYIDGTAYIDSIQSDSIVSAGQFGFKGTPVKTVTQQTSITTGVTINSPAGTIECVNHTFSSGTAYEFTVTNSFVSPEDVIILSFQDGNAYVFANVTDVNNGTFNISLIDIHNQGVTATLKINFAIIEHDQT